MMLRTLVRDSLSRNKAVGLGVGLGLGLALSCASVPHSFRGAVCKSSSTPDHAGKGGDLSGSGVDPGAKHDRADREEECTLREEVIGSYEDRIRNFSSSERVFEFFASVTNEKGTFMTPADFARAITPFQHRRGVKVGSDNFKFNFQAKNNRPTKEQMSRYKDVLKNILEDNRVTPAEVKDMLAARERYHITEEAHRKVLRELGVAQAQLDDLAEAKGGITKDRFLAMVDIDGDGLISYQEFMLFRTLLAIPKRKLAIAFRMFDRDDSGAVDWFEFGSFMNVLKGETNVGKTEVARQHRSDAQVANRLFFAEDSGGDDKLTMRKFSTYVQTLQQEALVMQFHQWDRRGEGTLTATDFAKYLATKITSNRGLYKEYLKRAESDELAQLEVAISVEEFLAFHELLQHLPEMEVAMKVSGSVEGRGLDRPEFLRAAHAALRGGRLRQEASATKSLNVPNENVVKGGLGNTNKSRTAKSPLSDKYTNIDQINASKAVKHENVLSPGVLDTLFVLLDTNNNGRLEQDEFMKLMKRQAAIPDPPRQLGIVSFLRRVKNCAEEVVF